MPKPDVFYWKNTHTKRSLTIRISRSKHASKGWMEQTLLATLNFLRNSVSNDELATKIGFLQQREPRTKLLGIIVLLISTLIATHIIELLSIYALVLALAYFSCISITFFLKRTLLFIPIFSFFIILPAIVNPATIGDPLVSLKIVEHTFVITSTSIITAIRLLLRVIVSVSLAVLLVLSTQQQTLLNVLSSFKVPRIFVMITRICFRYVYLFLDIILNKQLAIKSRVGFINSTRTSQRLAAMNISGLWLRAYHIQTQVYSAMLSRGYSGDTLVLDHVKIRFSDWLAIASVLTIFMGVLWLNHYLN